MSSAKPFRVAYIERPIDPAFVECIRQEPQVQLIAIPATLPETEIAAALGRCNAYYVGGTRGELAPMWQVTGDFLRRFPNIILVVSQAAGFDTVDLPACEVAGVPLINQAGGNAAAVAEHAIGMMLALFKRMTEADAALRAGQVRDRNALMGRELGHRTVGLVGCGHTGSRTGRLASAFGCRVLAFDPHVDQAAVTACGAEKVDLARLLADSDVVSLHCPRTPETMGLFGAAEFARMRPGALFISTARGGVHDEDALFEALQSGHLGGAGLDVWDPEPPMPDNRLLSLPTVIATPHLAGVTKESRANVGRMGAGALIAACRGEVLPRVVNPVSCETFHRRWNDLPGADPRA